AGGSAVGDRPPAVSDQEQIAFLRQHWQAPIHPQGRAPARFSVLEASLDPESCGVCHRPQYDDWKTSVHRKSMGPGVMGQTMELIQDDPSSALECYRCHAPLSEQQEKVGGKSGSRSHFKRNRAYLASMQVKGLTCAGCHVRKHQHYGPPKRDGSIENSLPASQLPHGGAIRTPAFERAEFCKGCHQFEPDGYALNGKLLENTYNEWKEGPSGREGRACQSCHMPDRRHTWRGIHDPEMVRQGVTVRLTLDRRRYQVGDRVQAVLTLANTGVGHYFPTYVTPKVVVRLELVDAEGKRVGGSLEEARIGREVTLDLSRELFDTRIPPGGTHAVRYDMTIDRPGLMLKASVVVAPDDFYVKFFEAIVPKAKTKKARSLLQQALDDASKSYYVLFEEEVGVS
ncbi:MAG: multiheme c-type cytochrome, partial [Candidatus Methylomirabilis sp.]